MSRWFCSLIHMSPTDFISLQYESDIEDIPEKLYAACPNVDIPEMLDVACSNVDIPS